MSARRKPAPIVEPILPYNATTVAAILRSASGDQLAPKVTENPTKLRNALAAPW